MCFYEEEIKSINDQLEKEILFTLVGEVNTPGAGTIAGAGIGGAITTAPGMGVNVSPWRNNINNL